MKYSVIVPVYNVENYLADCVESILSQSYKNFELLLVDDGSLDSSPELCDSYAEKDSRVKVLHKKNGGLSDARNAGVNMATGDYILFVDSDDYWSSPYVLEKIFEILEKNRVDLVQFGQEKFYQNDNKIVPGPKRNLSQFNGLPTSQVLSHLILSEKLTISACSMAISRQFFVNNDLYFEKGLKTEDLEWAIRMYLCEPEWSFIDEYFYIYRKQREDSISSTVDYKHLCDYCWIIEKSVSIVENSDESVKVPLMSYLMYHMLIASALTYRINLDKMQRKEILSRLKAVCKGRIIKYTMGKKVRLASYVYRIGGFSFMAKVLGFYLNNRGH